jgi:hypothetical protein
MAHRNWVTPYGDIVKRSGKGGWMGNRGCLHRGDDLVRSWNGKRWITCALEFRGWTAPKWEPGRWTALFFLDEAVALSAGHRPCALCRRADYVRYCATVGLRGAGTIDAHLHAQRLAGRSKRLHSMPWPDVPVSAFVELSGEPVRVMQDHVLPWWGSGYGDPLPRPRRGSATVITPELSLVALRNGYARPD